MREADILRNEVSAIGTRASGSDQASVSKGPEGVLAPAVSPLMIATGPMHPIAHFLGIPTFFAKWPRLLGQ